MLTGARIKEHAAALGFDLCGIAPVDSFPELAVLPDWLSGGYAGEMAWMTRTARSVPMSVKSCPARAGDRDVHSTTPTGRTRRAASRRRADFAYAWGDDYHDVLKDRLDTLLAWMREQAGEPFEARAYVDTGPVQERVYAQYAGIGWIGKNTCLINPEIGSWLFLGEIICTLTLEPDTQGLEQCGSCTRCLEACPTGALVEPGVLDSNRCLSYLTIELRSAIPPSTRAALGGHVYGCDICQEVCPYNRPAPASSDAPWQPRGTRPASPGRSVASSRCRSAASW